MSAPDLTLLANQLNATWSATTDLLAAFGLDVDDLIDAARATDPTRTLETLLRSGGQVPGAAVAADHLLTVAVAAGRAAEAIRTA
ncbi:hypothetical protein [Nocardia puris]|uniref:hypothetical protein n=1 Tax=Nocardia puris TaxID=208602 RepID=UPI002E228688